MSTTTNKERATMSKQFQATVQRTRMIGGGTSYKVYVNKKQKDFHPLYGDRYATTTSGSSLRGEFFTMADFLMRKEDMELCVNRPNEAWSERFAQRHKEAEALELDVLRRAFPETKHMDKVPSLWANWNVDSNATVQVPFTATI